MLTILSCSRPFVVKPRIITRLHDADIENGTSHQLNCSAYGDPNVTYKWSKDGSQIIPNSEVINQNKSLKVVIVTIQSEGIYKCMVENSVGNDSTTANITVFGKYSPLYHYHRFSFFCPHNLVNYG